MKDPRRTNKGSYFYPLLEILFLTISAVISRAENWTMIHEFGNAKLNWLRKYFVCKNGIPSPGVLGKLFARLDNKEFATCFTHWINSILELTEGEVVAIEGKTIRNSNKTKNSKSVFYVVSAYAAENRLCIGQEVVINFQY